MSITDVISGYYEPRAEEYVRRTEHLDFSLDRARFLATLPAGSHVLDLGTGSGRDARAFLDAGYLVTATDGSPALSRLASRRLGQEVITLRHEDLDWEDAFDGIWAYASLLHLEWEALVDVTRRLSRALRPGGCLFVAFKHGSVAEDGLDEEGRYFTYLDSERARDLIRSVPRLRMTWIDVVVDKRRRSREWIRFLAVRGDAS